MRYARCPHCHYNGTVTYKSEKIERHEGELGIVITCKCKMKFEVFEFELNK